MSHAYALPPLTTPTAPPKKTTTQQAARLQAARRLVREHFSRLPGRYALNVEGPEVVAIDMRLMAEARGVSAASDQCVPGRLWRGVVACGNV